LYAVRRVKRVGFELQITREMELLRGGVGMGGGHGEQAARVSRGQGRWHGEVASAARALRKRRIERQQERG
jgi:hypothetical protein